MMKTGVILAALGLAGGLLVGSAGEGRSALPTLQVANDLCTKATRQAETEARVPRDLLTAISLAESGRWDERLRASFAWPWTVTNGAGSMYYPTKQDAIDAVKALQKAGKTNIDVGCMQINLYHHPNAFESLEDAFDPTVNVGYASRFLAGLQRETNSWAEAAGRYHSSDPARLGAYRDKVLALWEKVSGRSHTELGKIQVVKADAEAAELRRMQQATIQMQFRARLEAERNAPKNGRAMAQLEKFRQDRWGPNFRNKMAAANAAAAAATETATATVSASSAAAAAASASTPIAGIDPATSAAVAPEISRKLAAARGNFAAKQTFEEKRIAQMAAWRETRSFGAFRQ